METLLQSATQAEELRTLGDASGRYDYPRIFEAPGWLANRRNRKRLRILKQLDASLDRILHAGERVIGVAAGVELTRPRLRNTRLLVFMTVRLLILWPSTLSYRLGPLANQIRWGALERASLGILGDSVCLQVRESRSLFGDGEEFRFGRLRFGGAERVESVLEIARRTPRCYVDAQEHLCRHCFEPSVELLARCRKCRGTFKSGSRALLLTALFPGLGELYLGYWGLACLEMLGGLVFYGMAAATLLLDDVSREARIGAAGFALLVSALCAMFGFDAARKGLCAARPGSKPVSPT
jgi:hypothetical protein